MTLSFFRFDDGLSRLWALAMMGLARPALARIAGLEFWKLCGSGTGEGFTPVPNASVYAILCVWYDFNTARDRIGQTRVFERYRRRATEHWTVFLGPISARGKWAGVAPFRVQASRDDGPVAALTRATIRPSVLLRFWQRVPDISRVIGADPNVLFKIGIGEVPWLRQITFSIWPDPASIAAFARESGPHARAIRAVREGNWFREELYARFTVLDEAGNWRGANPLTAGGASI